MSGRHRTPTTNLCLTRAGALGLMLATPLAAPGPAMAAQPGGIWHTPEESPRDDDTGDYLGRYRDQGRDARQQDRERRRNENSGDPDSGDPDNDDPDNDDRPRYRDAEDDRGGSPSRRARAREAAASLRDRDTDITPSRDDDSEGKYQDARWDELAECESSQNWDADTGNGYRGGLQFSESTWREHGGRRYAPSADQASREEQIEVAKDVQREQGWGAWPSCSEKLGYT